MNEAISAGFLSGCLLLSGFGFQRPNLSSLAAASDSILQDQTPPAVVQKSGVLKVLPTQTPLFTYEIVTQYPHDPEAFTQGLVFRDGYLYESTGLNGASSLRQVELTSGRILRKTDLPVQYWGEGLAILGNRIFQLTWTSQKGFIYGFDSFALQSEFAYRGEGWGLTEDGAFLIMSDGTSQIRFLDPANLHTTRVISVMDGDRPIERLNELEYVQGQIFANVWQTDLIVCINPINGNVVKWIDLAGLLPLEDRMRYTDVLNGIAYDRNGDRLFATGKFWPKLFQIRLRRSDRK